jgi:hypothetical protein
MTGHDPNHLDTVYRQAMTDADSLVNAATVSATIAPLLILNIAIAVRAALAAHRPHPALTGPHRICPTCNRYYPCDTATTLLAALSANPDDTGD